MSITVRLLIGAHAYACIEHGARKTDIRLNPGKSAWASLRETADEYHREAVRKDALAALCEEAATILEGKARPVPPTSVADRHMDVIKEAQAERASSAPADILPTGVERTVLGDDADWLASTRDRDQ